MLLIEGAERVLTGFPPSLSASAQRALEHIGVTPLLRHVVTAIDAESVTTTSPAGAHALPGAHRRVGGRGHAVGARARARPPRRPPSPTARGA